MIIQKDNLTDLVDEVDNDNDGDDSGWDLDDDQAVSENGDIITLDF